jgi:hypothetical protein
MFILMNVYKPAVNATVGSSCSLTQRTWSGQKNYFLRLLDLAILNGFIILSSCGNKMQLQKFDSGSDSLEMSVTESHYLIHPQQEDQA